MRYRQMILGWQMMLGQWRPLALSKKELEFRESVKDLPDEAIVVSTDGELSILVDGNGNLLAFK